MTFYLRPTFLMWHPMVLKYLHRVFQNCLQEVVEVVVEVEQLTPPKRPCIFVASEASDLFFRPSFSKWHLVVLKYLHRDFQNCLQEVVVVEVVEAVEQLTPPKRPCILKNQLCRMEADIEICLQFFYMSILAIGTFLWPFFIKKAIISRSFSII